jgi:flagellar hook-associated protein 3 FlgL
MTLASLGDLAQSLTLRRNGADLQRRMDRLTGEMSTGLKADRSVAVSGDHRALTAIESTLGRLGTLKSTVAEAEQFTGAVQTALGTMQDTAGAILPGLLSADSMKNPTQVRTLAADARGRLDSVLATLNVQVAGRYAMAGSATDTKPFVDAATLLADLGTAIAGQVTVSGVEAAVTAWFDAPAGGGGYLDLAYRGTQTPPGPFPIDDGTTATVPATGGDPAIRDYIRGLATAALVAEGALAGDEPGRAQLVGRAGATLATATDAVVALRADVGVVEERVSNAATRISAETTSLRLARADLVEADPYDTANAITDIQTRIETLYALTARLSKLTLTDWLR